MGADNFMTGPNAVQRGDYSITLSGNIFNYFDRDFFSEVIELCKRRGFNRYVHTVAVRHFGVDPRTEETK